MLFWESKLIHKLRGKSKNILNRFQRNFTLYISMRSQPAFRGRRKDRRWQNLPRDGDGLARQEFGRSILGMPKEI